MTPDSTRKETRASLAISALLHIGLLFLLLTVGIPTVVDEGLKITEISYLERYGAQVAKKVTLKKAAGGDISGVASKPAESQDDEPGVRTPRFLRRHDHVPPTKLDENQPVEIHNELKPRPRSMPSFNVAQGQLVGMKTRLDIDDLPFQVEEHLPTSLEDQADMELAMHIPVGGAEGGNHHFVGGVLSPGKRVIEEIPATLDGGGNSLLDLTDLDPGHNGSSGGNGGGSGGNGGVESGKAVGATKQRETPITVQRHRKLQELSQEIVAEPTVERRSAPKEENLKSNAGVTVKISGQISNRGIVRSASPEYPEEARREGIEGAVSLHLTVMPDGSVKDNVYVEETSGYRSLDRAAMEAIKRWLFAPLSSAVTQVEQWGIVTVIFKLQ